MISLIFNFRLISKDNEKVFNRYGRPFLSKKFKIFAQNVASEARKQYKAMPITFDIAVEIWAYFKDKRHCDLFNLQKSAIDSLNKIIWVDDRQIKIGSVNVVENSKTEYFKILVNKI